MSKQIEERIKDIQARLKKCQQTNDFSRVTLRVKPSSAVFLMSAISDIAFLLEQLIDLQERMEQIRELIDEVYPYGGFDDDPQRINRIMELSDYGRE